jgi:ParB family chromosome partitioning protein
MSEDQKTKSGESRKALGRGLASLLGPAVNSSSSLTSLPDLQESPKSATLAPEQTIRANLPYQILDIANVQPNPDQPRKIFNQAKLEELAASIKEHGIVQPILVRKGIKSPFEIIAGERRWRAAQLAGLSKIPVILRSDDSDEEKDDLVSLIENLQREDLNPLELAAAYSRLLVSQSYSQESLADRLGVSRVAVANTVRLLRLPDPVKEMLKQKLISEGHARALLALPGDEMILAFAEQSVAGAWSVRELEARVKAQLGRSGGSKASGRLGAGDSADAAAAPVSSKSPELMIIEDELRRIFGTKVAIRGHTAQGAIEIYFSGKESLHRIIHQIRGLR